MPSPGERAAEYGEVLRSLDSFSSFEASADPKHLSRPSSIRRLLEDLGHPERGYPIIHLAGTHGKGLTAAMIAAILEREGYRTGLYTSPYVVDLRETIQIGGSWISEESFACWGAQVAEVAAGYGHGLPLSKFDLMTAIGLLAFRRSAVDWAIVETGLGGRLDSTNVTDKALAVITPIDYEHAAVLGETLSEIAEHKLGIVRAGTPVVLSEQDEALGDVISQKLGTHEPYVGRSRDLRLHATASSDRFEVEWPDGLTHHLRFDPRFPLRVHLECCKTALAARYALALGDDGRERRSTWAKAAAQVSLSGRLSQLDDAFWPGCERPFERVVLDGCHTPAAVRACARQLEAWEIDQPTLVLGLSSDKLTARLRAPLGELCRQARQIVLTPFGSPRSGAPATVARFLLGIDPAFAPRLCRSASLDEAMRRAAGAAERPLVVAGSLYLIRDVLSGLACSEPTPRKQE